MNVLKNPCGALHGKKQTEDYGMMKKRISAPAFLLMCLCFSGGGTR